MTSKQHKINIQHTYRELKELVKVPPAAFPHASTTNWSLAVEPWSGQMDSWTCHLQMSTLYIFEFGMVYPGILHFILSYYINAYW